MTRKAQVVGASLPFARHGRYGWQTTAVADRIDQAYEAAMGRKWDRPFSAQFAYTGRRKGDKGLLQALLVESAPEAKAA